MKLCRKVLIGVVSEELVVLICSRTVVHRLLEAHLEVSCAHGQRVPYLGFFLLLKLLWRKGVTSRGRIGELIWSVRLTQRKIGIPGLLDKLSIRLLGLGHRLGVQLVLLG